MRSLQLGPVIMTIKRLTDGCGARNGFGLKGWRASSIADLEWRMEGFGRRAALWKASQNGKRDDSPRMGDVPWCSAAAFPGFVVPDLSSCPNLSPSHFTSLVYPRCDLLLECPPEEWPPPWDLGAWGALNFGAEKCLGWE